jgi:hypothetical protein
MVLNPALNPLFLICVFWVALAPFVVHLKLFNVALAA